MDGLATILGSVKKPHRVRLGGPVRFVHVPEGRWRSKAGFNPREARPVGGATGLQSETDCGTRTRTHSATREPLAGSHHLQSVPTARRAGRTDGTAKEPSRS